MKIAKMLVVVMLVLFAQAAVAAVVVDITYDQYNAMSNIPVTSSIKVGHPALGLGINRGDPLGADVTADGTYSNGGVIHVTNTYSGGLWSFSDGVSNISTRPTQPFQIVVLGSDANNYQMTLTVANVLLDGQALPSLFVSQTGNQFSGYAFMPANIGSFTLTYDITPTWTSLSPSLFDLYATVSGVPNGDGGIVVVPEPTTTSLIIIGLGLIAYLRFRERKKKRVCLKNRFAIFLFQFIYFFLRFEIDIQIVFLL